MFLFCDIMDTWPNETNSIEKLQKLKISSFWTEITSDLKKVLKTNKKHFNNTLKNDYWCQKAPVDKIVLRK